MVDFPKGSKNEAIVNQFNSLNEKGQIKMLIDAHQMTSDLTRILKKNGLEEIKVVKGKDSSDLERFKAEIATISNLKNQAKDNKIDVSRVSGVEKYGNEKVQSQNKSMGSDILNKKPGYMNKDGSYSQPSSTEFKPSLTPNVSRPTSSGQKR